MKNIIAKILEKEYLEKDKILERLKKEEIEITQEELNNILEEMRNEGIVYYNKKTEKYTNLSYKGMQFGGLEIDKNKNGLLKTEQGTITIPERYLKDADSKDKVVVAFNEDTEEWRVIDCIKTYEDFVGEIYKDRGKLFVKNNKRRTNKEIANSDNLTYDEGCIVLVSQNPKDDKVTIKKIIGLHNEPGMDIKKLLCEEGFDPDFDEEYEEEISKIPTKLTEKEIKEELDNCRIDFRNELEITIDCDDTQDIDDAIIEKKLPNGNYLLRIAIADVAHYVKEGSKIDKRAEARGTSCYPPGTVSPMLPPELSNGICSLNPDVDRLCVVYSMEIDKEGNIIKFHIDEGISKSRKKMKYSEVNKILEENEMVPGYEEYVDLLKEIQELASIIENKLIKEGFIDFHTRELKMLLDESGVSRDKELREQKTAEKIIAFFMLITNICTTEYFECLKAPWIYRIDGEPNQRKLSSAFNLLKTRGYIEQSDLRKVYKRKDILKALKRIEGVPEEEILNNIIIRGMAKAEVCETNIGHYPIGCDAYGQITSPIRRDGDLKNERIVKYSLKHTMEETRQKYGDLHNLCIHLSKQEIKADEIEKEGTKIKAAEYMSKNIGDVQNGIISGITDYGIWVLLESGIEGFIHKSELPKDKYKYDKDSYAMYGKKNDNKFIVGDQLKVMITNANKETRSIDLSLLPELQLNKAEESEIHERRLIEKKKRSKQKQNRY